MMVATPDLSLGGVRCSGSGRAPLRASLPRGRHSSRVLLPGVDSRCRSPVSIPGVDLRCRSPVSIPGVDPPIWSFLIATRCGHAD
eukprot:1904208-Prymnesium_polylepis.1